MGTKRTAEFRQEAVRIALTSGLTRKQVASDLNVGFSTLCKWIQQDQKNPEKPSGQSDLEREISVLRKENRLLREERDILKKATVYSLRAKSHEVPVLRRKSWQSSDQTVVQGHECQFAVVTVHSGPVRLVKANARIWYCWRISGNNITCLWKATVVLG